MKNVLYLKIKSIIMKKFFPVLLLFTAFACTSQQSSEGKPKSAVAAIDKRTSDDTKTGDDAVATGGCGSSLLFKEGVVIHGITYDRDGKVTAKHASTIKKVYSEGGVMTSEVEVKTVMGDPGATEKTMNAVYKCDGKKLYVDLSSFLSSNKNAKVETSGFAFPDDLSVGDTLPDASYTVKMNIANIDRIVKSHIKERKVEAKEKVTTPAGTFDCYRISSVIEVDADMIGMDERKKAVMAQVQKTMGKNKLIFWYAPDVTIIKMEYHMGDKLVTRNEVTEIDK